MAPTPARKKSSASKLFYGNKTKSVLDESKSDISNKICSPRTIGRSKKPGSARCKKVSQQVNTFNMS